MANVTRKSLNETISGLNTKLGRPTTQFILNEDSSKTLAEGHLDLDITDNRYKLVEYTTTGIKDVTPEAKSAREMAAFLEGVVAFSVAPMVVEVEVEEPVAELETA